ncbi:MAG: ABC transporter permease subunit [Oscillospiraceae bacterium]
MGVLILGASVGLLTVFFHTQLGLSIRATGDNADMVRSSSINTNFTQSVGLAVANALVALSGALVAQYQMFADIGMGIGMVVIGLASLIIGEVLIGTKSILRHLIAVRGAVLYRIIIALVLQANVAQSDLKIISAVLVAAALSFPAIRANRLKFRLRKENRRA